MPSAKRKVVEIIVKVVFKKPKPKIVSGGGYIGQKPPIHPVKYRKSKAQQRMEEDLEREMKRIKEEQK